MFGADAAERNGYSLVALSDIFDKPQGGEWGEDDTTGIGTPVLRTTNFTDGGYIDYSDVATRIIPEDKIKKKALTPGDILIEKSGGSGEKPVGRVVFFEGEPEKYLNNNFTARLHLSGKYTFNPAYVFYFMFVNYWQGGTKIFEGKTTGIHNLRLGDFLNGTQIPIAEIDKQNEFETIMRQSDKSKLMMKSIYLTGGKKYVTHL